jgi:hypothetical protein
MHARLAGETFARFHIDLSSGDALVFAPDLLEGSGLLSFADVEPILFPVYPVVQHLAEKIHAYTLPRLEANTRAKDLFDLAMLAALEAIDGGALNASVLATFSTRATHSPPFTIPEPPEAWSGPFAQLVREAPTVPIGDLGQAFALVSLFWNPVFSGTTPGHRWLPDLRAWSTWP